MKGIDPAIQEVEQTRLLAERAVVRIAVEEAAKLGMKRSTLQSRMAKLGIVPAAAVSVIRKKAKFDPVRVEEIERETKHDVIAFLTNVGEYVGPESRFIHLGMTSSDVLDTGLAIQMKQSAELLLKDLEALAAVLKETLQFLQHEIKDRDILNRTAGPDSGVNDAQIVEVLAKMVKQRQDSLQQFEAAGRENHRVGFDEFLLCFLQHANARELPQA